MAEIALRNVTKAYGPIVVVDNLSLDVRDGEFLTLLGASGSGKTTCLRIVAGFVKPDSGLVLLGGTDATHVPPYRRSTGMVFQSYALFPHLTIADNVAYGLRIRRLPKREIAERTAEVLKLVHLEQLKDRYPAQLSGGQKQRVALARAVAIRPTVLLLDEPLSALDMKLRGELQGEIRRIQQTLRITTLFVTHDQGEALGMSDRVAVMRGGKILQVDAPVNLYQRPNSSYVANFIGTTNLIEGIVQTQSRVPGGGRAYRVGLAGDGERIFEAVSAANEGDFTEGDRCLLCIRPENARLGGHAPNTIEATVSRVTYVGQHWVADCIHTGGGPLTINLPAARGTPGPGDKVVIGWDPQDSILLKYEQAAHAA